MLAEVPAQEAVKGGVGGVGNFLILASALIKVIFSVLLIAAYGRLKSYALPGG